MNFLDHAYDLASGQVVDNGAPSATTRGHLARGDGGAEA